MKKNYLEVDVYKAQYKSKNSYEIWINLGSYGSEAQAISRATRKKDAGAFMVRVIDRDGAVVFSN